MNWPVVFLISLLISFSGGTALGIKWHSLEMDKKEKERLEAQASALEAAAKEIAKIKVTNVTRNVTLEKQIETQVMYKECRHTPEALKTINDALKGAK